MLATACVYRFSGLHKNSPRRVAIEAIYDTTHHYLPHAKIRTAVEEVFIAAGRYSARSEAEALLRIHFRQASVKASLAVSTLYLDVTAELWDLTSQTLMFTKDYRLHRQYQTVFPTLPSSWQFLRAEETRSDAVTQMGADLARQVRDDLFISSDFRATRTNGEVQRPR